MIKPSEQMSTYSQEADSSAKAYLSMLILWNSSGINPKECNQSLGLIRETLYGQSLRHFCDQIESYAQELSGSMPTLWADGCVDDFFNCMEETCKGESTNNSLFEFFNTWTNLEDSHQKLIEKVAIFYRESYEYCVELLTSKSKDRKPQERKEQSMEDDLYLWLVSEGIEADKQVSTSQKHRIDIWIPGVTMLELKAQKVTGDDVCQAIDYYEAYRIPITLIGGGLTESASRGLIAFNKIVPDDMITFVSWGASRRYLSSLTKE